MRPILLSIKPRFAEAIYSGQKTIELRKRRPRIIGEGATVFLYETTPVKQVTGYFVVANVIETDVSQLWSDARNQASVSRREYDEYFRDSATGVGLYVSDAHQFRTPLDLGPAIGLALSARPPQSFRYVDVQPEWLACCTA
jgi:predicted transcriptional regulator